MRYRGQIAEHVEDCAYVDFWMGGTWFGSGIAKGRIRKFYEICGKVAARKQIPSADLDTIAIWHLPKGKKTPERSRQRNRICTNDFALAIGSEMETRHSFKPNQITSDPPDALHMYHTRYAAGIVGGMEGRSSGASANDPHKTNAPTKSSEWITGGDSNRKRALMFFLQDPFTFRHGAAGQPGRNTFPVGGNTNILMQTAFPKLVQQGMKTGFAVIISVSARALS